MGQNYHFAFMPKIIRILRSCSMKIFSKLPTVNISKLNYWLVICIAKNNFKDDFLNIQMFLHILSKPYINGKIIYSAFRWCIHLSLIKRPLLTGCVVRIWSAVFRWWFCGVSAGVSRLRISEEQKFTRCRIKHHNTNTSASTQSVY